MIEHGDLVTLFESANNHFLKDDVKLFEDGVSERTLCGALMLHLHEAMWDNPMYNGFHADVEYNRNRNTIKKILQKKEDNDDEIIVNINCDILVHGRGQTQEQENLIAIEMKKDYAQEADKNRDRYRLEALTSDPNEWRDRGLFPYDGVEMEDIRYNYVLGVYYEVSYSDGMILIEYYQKGEKLREYEVCGREQVV